MDRIYLAHDKIPLAGNCGYGTKPSTSSQLANETQLFKKGPAQHRFPERYTKPQNRNTAHDG
jgi:hypothetical protein